MKLQTKFILTLLGGTLVMLLATQIFQQVMDGRALGDLSRDNLSLLEQREQSHADNIYQTIDPVVQSSIMLGEMPKLDLLISSYSHLDGLLEYSIYDHNGLVSYSTSRDLIKARKKLADDVKTQVLTTPAKFSRRTGEAYEIYDPMVVSAKCLECHDDFKLGQIGGVALLRLSTATLDKSRQSWSVATAKIEHTDIQAAVYTTLLISLVFSVLACWTVKRLITRPLGNIITQLTREATQLHQGADEITASSQMLAEGASEQAASLEETSASLEELSSMTKRNGEIAQNADDLAKQARTAADQGVADMQTMNSAMTALNDSSADIAKIIKTIDEIAFQTNILALNAAVEAARAGEAGMGFAVVADEVRNLAQRSAQAAKETAAKIEGTIGRTAQGVEVSQKVAATLNVIVGKAREMDELAAEVAGGSKEQSQGISQINLAVGEMDKVTQANAAGAEESAASAQELNRQAAAVKETVAELVRLIGGRNPGDAERAVDDSEPGGPTRQTTPATRRPAPANRNGHGRCEPVKSGAAKVRDEIPMDADFKDF
jgi:methyl-accepting chemotaxis protein